MGSNTLTPVSSPVSTDDIDQYRTALLGDHLPRNASSGAPEGGQHSLGSGAISWKSLYTSNLYIGGVLFDPTGTGGEVNTSNAIISGATRTTSEQPDFLRASGAAATVTILATTTPLSYTANGSSATISVDTAVTSLTTAPATNNTCLVNDTNLADQESTKFLGEEGTTIPVDTMGSELTSRVGQYVCLKTANNEYMLAFIKSITELTMCYRGYFIDSTGAPIFRETLANNDTLTLMSLGWVFGDADGTTIDVSYVSPLYEDTEPSSGTTDDYWFDTSGQQWYRYSGATWDLVSRMLLGLAVIDTINCVASRSFDITQGYFDHNTVECELFSTTQVYSKQGRSQLSVYGNTHYFNGGAIIWDIANDLESPLTEQASTVYYLYITETGEHVMSDKRPHDRRSDLKGWYHPHNTWLCVGIAYNDGSSNLVYAMTYEPIDTEGADEISTASSFNLYPSNNRIQEIAFTASSQDITLPNAILMSEGKDPFIISNTGSLYPFIIKDNAGNKLCELHGGQTVSLYLVDNSTTTGNWRLTNVSSNGSELTLFTGIENIEASYGFLSTAMTQLDTNKFIMLYYDSTPSDYMSVVITVSDETISVGTPVQVSAAVSAGHHLGIYKMSATQALAIYTPISGDRYGMVLDISGTVITTNIAYLLDTSYGSATAGIFELSTNKFIYCYPGSAAYVKGRVLDISGTVITTGSEQSIVDAGRSVHSCCKLSDTRFAIMCGSVSRIYTATVSGATITKDSGEENRLGGTDHGYLLNLDNNKVLAVWIEFIDADYGDKMYGQILEYDATRVRMIHRGSPSLLAESGVANLTTTPFALGFNPAKIQHDAGVKVSETEVLLTYSINLGHASPWIISLSVNGYALKVNSILPLTIERDIHAGVGPVIGYVGEKNKYLVCFPELTTFDLISKIIYTPNKEI